MFELKSLSKETIPAALNKAERYRFLGEPVEAESICLDILDVEPDNEKALITLILALTDQFGQRQNPNAFKEALDSVSRLKDDYNKAYYTGIIYERRAKAHLNQPVPGAGHVAYGWFAKAMEFLKRRLRSVLLGMKMPFCDGTPVLGYRFETRVLAHNPKLSKLRSWTMIHPGHWRKR